MPLYYTCKTIQSHTSHMPNVSYYMYVCPFVCLMVALRTILSLMLATSHPKAIGGVF